MTKTENTNNLMEEEDIWFKTNGLFYNPHMQLSRSISSLIVGSLDMKLNVIDGFSSTGIRGIRYLKENKNVKSLTFVDWSENAIQTTLENSKLNKLKNNKAIGVNSDFNRFMVNRYVSEFSDSNFIEIDPFGSPFEHIPIIMYAIQKQKEIILSVTATDMQVLCGPAKDAAIRHYLAKTLNNMFTHETGTRVLLGYIFRMGLQYNFDMIPIMSLSFRHHIKVIVRLIRNTEDSMKSLENLGFVSHCPKCHWTKASMFPIEKCFNGHKTKYAGPLWIGRLHNIPVLRSAIKLNEKRDYTDRKRIGQLLGAMIEENELPPYFYKPSNVVKGEVKKLDEIIECLKKKGYLASKTHFSQDGIKTDANIRLVEECMKK